MILRDLARRLRRTRLGARLAVLSAEVGGGFRLTSSTLLEVELRGGHNCNRNCS
jgi:hypothetical protein